MTERSPLIDFTRSSTLWDVGCPEYVAAVAVDADAAEQFWLVLRGHVGDPDTSPGNANQPHEQLGRLPRAFRDAIWGDQLRCGAITARGTPCRARVAQPGGRCGRHGERDSVRQWVG